MIKIDNKGLRFEISKNCSSALWEIINLKGWQDKEFFTLAIKKTPVILILEELITDPTYLFHVGCSTDNRSLSFEYRRQVRKQSQNSFDFMAVFFYERVLNLSVMYSHNWLRSSEENIRDIELAAQLLSEPKNYRERVSFFWSGGWRGFGRTVRLGISFFDSKIEFVERPRDIDEYEILRDKVKGFENSVWASGEVTVENLKLFIKSLYDFFKPFVAEFGVYNR